MKIETSKLLKAVTKAATVVEPTTTLPIIQNILFKEEGGELFLHATNLQTSIKVKVDDVEVEEGLSSAVQTRTLISLLKSVSGSLELSFSDAQVDVKAGTGKYQISAFNGEDFPLTDVIKGDKSKKGYVWERAVELTSGSVSTDDLRAAMQGLYFDGENGFVVATDGYRLSRYQFDIEGSFIVPPKSLSLLKGLQDEDVYYKVEDNHVHFTASQYAFKVRLIDAKYPPYEKVIPTGNNKTLSVSQEKLLQTAKRVALFANQETNALVLELNGETIVRGQDINFNKSATEKLEANYEGEELTIGLNSKYLTEILNTTGDGTLTVTFSEANRPVLVTNNTNNRLLQLIMPVSL